MLHACVERFDVMCVRGNILGWEGEVNAAIVMKIFCIRAFSVESVISIEGITWTPSSSFGRVSVRRGGVAANQTARAKSQ
jgi:hypothetical protein